MMEFVDQLVFIESQENRFSQMIINKKRFSQIRRIQKDSLKKKRFSQMITNKNKGVKINSSQTG